MTDKVLTLLGFASKAGALSFGAANAACAVSRGKAKGVFFANDISAKSRKEILFQCGKFGVEAFELENAGIDRLSNAVGRKCGVVAVLDDKFNTPLISYLASDREVTR